MKYQENLKVGWRKSLEPSLRAKYKTSVTAGKNYAETDIKVSWPCPILLNHVTLSH